MWIPRQTRVNPDLCQLFREVPWDVNRKWGDIFVTSTAGLGWSNCTWCLMCCVSRYLLISHPKGLCPLDVTARALIPEPSGLLWGGALMPLAYICVIQCEFRSSFWLVCLVLAVLEISGLGLGVWSARWPSGWTVFKGPARASDTPNSICAAQGSKAQSASEILLSSFPSYVKLLIHEYVCLLLMLLCDYPVNADWLANICHLLLFICI